VTRRAARVPAAPHPFTERQVQRAILRMCGSCFRDVYIHHSPNGSKLAGSERDRQVAGGILRGDGMKAGWPGSSMRLVPWQDCLHRGQAAEDRPTDARTGRGPRASALVGLRGRDGDQRRRPGLPVPRLSAERRVAPSCWASRHDHHRVHPALRRARIQCPAERHARAGHLGARSQVFAPAAGRDDAWRRC
jgi:hypothetical protein